MLWKLAEKRKDKLEGYVKPIRLAKVVSIQAIYPELYSLLKEEPRFLGDLEKYYRGELVLPSTVPEVYNVISASDVEQERTIPPALVPLIHRAAIRRILTLHPKEFNEANFIELKPSELRLYFTLTRRAEAPQATSFGIPLVFSEPQMVKIPAGKFLMGSTKEQAAQAIKDGADKKWVEWEQPQHTVELSEYSIGKYPVTNREYQAFVKDAKYDPPSDWDGEQFPMEKGGHPVVNVSWNDADAYFQWLSKKTSKGYRLPTEAEWEKAARGENGLIYPWGDEFDPGKANVQEAKIDNTSDVGAFSPDGDSPYGCADMIGNVWEWCADWFNENEYKNREGIIDPQGPSQGILRVVRGGSFYRTKGFARCPTRTANEPHTVGEAKGFRVAFSSSHQGFAKIDISAREHYSEDFSQE